MTLHRIILVVLLSFTTAFASMASVAMAKPCTITVEVNAGHYSVCPCNDMLDCRSMPQCRTAVGCANHCFAGTAILTDRVSPFTPTRQAVPSRYVLELQSLLIRPPIPPPRG